MKILALEFSSPQRSVALLDSPTPVPAVPSVPSVVGRSSPPDLTEAVEPGGGHTQAFTLIQHALETARLPREQVDCLAVGLGPGSYAGIRIAISIAQGWHLARAVRLLGIPSLECLAQQAHADGIRGRVHFLTDAQRNEFYLATCELTAAEPRVLEPLCLATLEAARARCQTGGTLIGFDVHRHFPEAKVLFPRAATLARLAAARSDFIPGERLEPVYLRPTSFVKTPPPRIIP